MAFGPWSLQCAAELSQFVTGSEPLILLEALLRNLDLYLRHRAFNLIDEGLFGTLLKWSTHLYRMLSSSESKDVPSALRDCDVLED